MDKQQIIEWLLEGDVSLQYQVHRDLLGNNRKDLQDRIAEEGWGKQLLSKRNSNGHWGDRFYQPKWISTHYTLLDLRNLSLNPENGISKEAIELTLNLGIAEDGGIPLGPSTSKYSDVCVNGMFLNYASYFKTDEKKLCPIVNCILNEIMSDGGFNCQTNRSGARHSSLHSTISALEGLIAYQKAGYSYRLNELQNAQKSAEEFILLHQLFLSDHTGEIIRKDFLNLPYPSRWKYDILRALDYFQYSGSKWDERMNPAIQVLLKKQNNDSTWNVQAKHPGKVHFEMEKAGKPSRWNTLRAMRVLEHFKIE
ncbi:MAG: hypothetical protein HN729_03185 [Candidatus Marinimicrobia bacterium]|jgi:hypothetical protein|nr:hypothetical protein [Candidatus Neomarinimicrobiota bacterium]MBT3759652.1 hypothetical protein [Candidatus Neomarinimicrobiota bacterium]MBT3894476.1 hypothetical protein [Candidatus Neomarinimicrobiota bacterium]MBT4172519.1 hypothetical protein [Candidatus Neomarinimicrobiota bacterium]MBT4537335.1 hypothetical protein [Candidatus Neomarinimicrobiota bacterium]